jgi:6-pyruvoyl-tetrahydropterin synthase
MPTAWSGGTMLTWVSGHFSAAHRDLETGEIHGHTWHVKAWFRNVCRSDARCYRAALDTMLKRLDHTMLPDDMAWAEDIARQIAVIGGVDRVEVSRPADGMGAEWTWERI